VVNTYNTDFLVETQSVAGDTASFAYDRDLLLSRAGRLSLVRGDSTGLVTSTAVVVGSVTSSLEHDHVGELSKLTYRHGEALLFEQTLSRDSLGRVTGIAECPATPRLPQLFNGDWFQSSDGERHLDGDNQAERSAVQLTRGGEHLLFKSCESPTPCPPLSVTPRSAASRKTGEPCAASS